MSALLKTANRYADERPPFVSAELNADLNSDHPSADALEWVRLQFEVALSDSRPPLTSDQVRITLLAHHDARLMHDRVV